MSAPKAAELVGVYNPIGEMPAFLVPVFSKRGEGYLVQEIDPVSDKITDFLPLDVDKRDLRLPFADYVKLLKPGDLSFHSFAFDEQNITVGSREELARTLKSKLDPTDPRRNLLLEIVTFIADADKRALTLQLNQEPEPVVDVLRIDNVVASLRNSAVKAKNEPRRAGTGVPPLLRDRPQLGMPDWESLRVFQEVARRGSFRSASDSLGVSMNALRRSVQALEHQLAVALITRHVDGVRLTEEGSRVLAAVNTMESAYSGLVRATGRSASSSIKGEVRIAVSEGLATFWLAPLLVDFQRTNPGLLVDVNCAVRSADVLRLEADVAVSLVRPTSPDVKLVKLGRLHAMPCVARPYIETHGVPTTAEELSQHRLVLQVDDQTAQRETYDRLFPGALRGDMVAVETNLSSTHYWAVAKGAGIGWLPTYMIAGSNRLVPLDIDLRFQYDIWATYHPDAARIPRVRRMIDWIIESFDPRAFSCFADEFIHPNDLPKQYLKKPTMNLFEDFGDGAEGDFGTRGAELA